MTDADLIQTAIQCGASGLLVIGGRWIGRRFVEQNDKLTAEVARLQEVRVAEAKGFAQAIVDMARGYHDGTIAVAERMHRLYLGTGDGSKGK